MGSLSEFCYIKQFKGLKTIIYSYHNNTRNCTSICSSFCVKKLQGVLLINVTKMYINHFLALVTTDEELGKFGSYTVLLLSMSAMVWQFKYSIVFLY